MSSGIRDIGLKTAVVLALLALVPGCAGAPKRAAAGPATPTATPAASAAASAAAKTPTPVPSPTRAAVGGDGTYRVGETQQTFTEPAHTSPTGQHLSQRTLVTQIWYPLASGLTGPFPLLMFAPGFRQCSDDYSELLRAWASAGYVVAAVDFPRTSCHAGASAYENDLVNQPADLSYVLSGLLADNARPHGTFSGLLDPQEVAAAGQSDGGDTVAALAANTCCTDRRLKAVAVLSGAEWPMPGRYFPGAAPPALFVQGGADTVNPPWASLQLYRADSAGVRYYLALFGASHLVPYEGTNPVERRVARVTLAFFDRYVLGQADALETMTRDGNSGASALVSGGHTPP